MTTISNPTLTHTLRGKPGVFEVFLSEEYQGEYCLCFEIHCNWQLSEEDAEVFRQLHYLLEKNKIGVYLEKKEQVQKIHLGNVDTVVHGPDDLNSVLSMAEIELLGHNPCFDLLCEQIEDEETKTFEPWDIQICSDPPIRFLRLELGIPALDLLSQVAPRSNITVRFFSSPTPEQRVLTVL